MTFAAPAGLLLLALAVPIVLLHILRPRRPQVVVGSTYLWQPLAQPVSAASPWQRLRPSVLLLLQPAGSGLGALVWALPVAALLLAAGGLALAFRRWRRDVPEAVTEDDRELVERARADREVTDPHMSWSEDPSIPEGLSR